MSSKELQNAKEAGEKLIVSTKLKILKAVLLMQSMRELIDLIP
jgi:hypothetical protein